VELATSIAIAVVLWLGFLYEMASPWIRGEW
jgi:hypothetical protein